MDTPLKPRPQQEEVIQRIVSDKKHLCAAKTGAGKTLIGTEAILRSRASITLIVGPLNTVKGWRKTVERQSQGTMPFHHINSRKDGKLAFEKLVSGERGVYFIGTEYFRRFGWTNIHLDFVVVDEGHRFANRKSLNARMLYTTRKVPYKLYLSATPAGNKIEGLWSGAHWLWPEEYPYFWPFVTKYLKTVRDPYAGKKIDGEKQPGAVWASLPSASKFEASYTVEPAVHEIEVELSPAQRKLYDKFEKDAIVWLEENPLVGDLPSTKAIRLREIALAVPSIQYTEDGEELVYFADDAKSSKIDMVLDLLADLHAEKPEPVLIYTHSKKFARVLTLQLQGKGYRARQFIGGMSAEERAWKIENFGKEFEILVATIPSISEGTDGFQLVCHYEIWVSVSDNRVFNTQAKGRTPREGQKHTVQRYYIQAANTVEVRQAGRLKSDQELLDASLETVEL